MKTLILYYSRSGNTKAFAEQKTKETGADIEQILDMKKLSVFAGILKSQRRIKTEIQPVKSQLVNYDKIIIMSPVWAGHPVPAINSLIECLPSGKQVEIVMVSSGGGTKKSAEGTKALVVKQGCELVGYTDVKVKLEGDEVIVQTLK